MEDVEICVPLVRYILFICAVEPSLYYSWHGIRRIHGTARRTVGMEGIETEAP